MPYGNDAFNDVLFVLELLVFAMCLYTLFTLFLEWELFWVIG